FPNSAGISAMPGRSCSWCCPPCSPTSISSAAAGSKRPRPPAASPTSPQPSPPLGAEREGPAQREGEVGRAAPPRPWRALPCLGIVAGQTQEISVPGSTISSLDMVRRLVGFDTTSRESNLALIDFVRDYLDGWGIASELVFDDTRRKANLYA